MIFMNPVETIKDRILDQKAWNELFKVCRKLSSKILSKIEDRETRDRVEVILQNLKEN